MRLVSFIGATVASLFACIPAIAGNGSESFNVQRQYMQEVNSAGNKIASCPPASCQCCKITVHFSPFGYPIAITLAEPTIAARVKDATPFIAGATTGQEVAARVEAALANP